MKFYFHPISTTSRPVQLFLNENNIEYEPIVVDLMTGAHHREPFTALNPSRQVPVIDDDGFVLSESSAILKYLADKIGSPTYPKEIKARARVNERMDWFNTGYYRELGYHLIYPQIYPHHKREPATVNTGTAEWGIKQTEFWLGVLDQNILGDQTWVAGPEMTIADYFGGGLTSSGDLVGINWSRFPKVARWLDRIKSLKSWKAVTEAHEGFVKHLSSQDLLSIR